VSECLFSGNVTLLFVCVCVCMYVCMYVLYVCVCVCCGFVDGNHSVCQEARDSQGMWHDARSRVGGDTRPLIVLVAFVRRVRRVYI